MHFPSESIPLAVLHLPQMTSHSLQHPAAQFDGAHVQSF